MYQDDMMNEGDGSGGMDSKRRATVSRQEPPSNDVSPTTLERKRPSRKRETTTEDEPTSITDKVPIQDNGSNNNSNKNDAAIATENQHQQPRTIPVHKVIPWKKNGSRTFATGGSPAYYGVYLYELTTTTRNIELKVMALGEWNLPSPETTLFCVRDYDDETWKGLAAKEQTLSKQMSYYQSRFDRAKWKPNRDDDSEQRGYYEGSLIFPRSVFPSHSYRNFVLSMSFAATTPWQTDYAIVDLLTLTPNGEVFPIPHSKMPVPPEDPWKPIFPRQVEDRFRARQVARDSSGG